MAKKSESSTPNELTVDHLAAGLLFIESWCRTARFVLNSLPPAQRDAIRFPATEAKEALMDPEITRYRPDGCSVPIFPAGVCPPPK